MNLITSMGILAGVGGAVLFIVAAKRKIITCFYFFLRMGLGIAEILFLNEILAKQGVSVFVGINPISLLTSGSLGISGVGLLFAIAFMKIL